MLILITKFGINSNYNISYRLVIFCGMRPTKNSIQFNNVIYLAV